MQLATGETPVFLELQHKKSLICPPPDNDSPLDIESPSSLYYIKSGNLEILRRNLPHWRQGEKLQFVTFRLGDSLPQTKLIELREEKDLWLKEHPEPWGEDTEAEYHRLFSQRVDKWLDSGMGSCALRDVTSAKIVEDAIRFFDKNRYDMWAYVVMPNHVHALIQTHVDYPLSSILHSWKSFTAKKINSITGSTGKFWAEESYDRLLRDECHYHNVVGYIYKNIMMGGVRWMI